ncbi:MAG TPA: hypothetical protein VGS57_02945 [Thermoanaerobaculia bacterium]|nr:hypothetical protein [Thermoanaerobaculia bacterium]
MRPHLGSWLAAVLLSLATAASAAAGTSADLQLTKSDSPDPVLAGGQITYDIVLFNAGPDASVLVSIQDTLPAGTTFVDLIVADPSWICTTPPVGSAGTITCLKDSLDPDTSGPFTLIVAVDSGVAPGTVITNTVVSGSETPDPDEQYPTATATTTVAAPPPTADVSVTKVDDPDPVAPGADLVYTITVTNTGDTDATSVSFVDALPPETTFVSLAQPGGWMCTTPPVGTNDSVICSVASLAPGSAVFTLTVNVGAQVTPGTQILNSATVSAENDADEGNNSASASTTVAGSAELSVTKTSSSPDPVSPGSTITYDITVTNAGPNFAAVTLTDPLPANTTFVSLSAPAGWSCTTPPMGSGGTVTCGTGSMGIESAAFTLTVAVDAGAPNGAVLTNTATVSSAAADSNPDDNSASVSRTVLTAAAVSGTKSVSGSFTPGGAITYTVVLTNNGGTTQGDNPGAEFTDVLPSSLTLVGATATSGTATPNVGTNTVTWNGSIAAGASVTITINATIDAGVAPGTTISNQGTIAYDADGNGTNEATAVTDDPSTQPSDDPTSFQVAGGPAPVPAIPALDWRGLLALAALCAAIGAWRLRARRPAAA